MDNYEQVFGELPKKEQSPLDKDDHPEVDTTEELGPEDIAIYQSFIGCLQWAVTLGRIDIMIATMTLSRFRPAPRRGHLQRRQACPRLSSQVPTRCYSISAPAYRDHEATHPTQEYDWDPTVYDNAKEERPKNAPTQRASQFE